MLEDVHLFLLVPNDSGSTWLQNIISLCENCVSFPQGLDGKGACIGTDAYPHQKINKLFSEKKEELWKSPDAFEWETIKSQWHQLWSEDPHYSTARPRIYLEKTPQAIYASDMYFEQFDNVHFIIGIRNPYAVAEGMVRTIGGVGENVGLRRCIKHWIRCAKRQIYNWETYRDSSIMLTYEELVGYPEQVEQRIKQFIPALYDLDFTKEVRAHSVEGMEAKPVTDFNERQLSNLSPEDISVINQELESVPEILDYFGYRLL